MLLKRLYDQTLANLAEPDAVFQALNQQAGSALGHQVTYRTEHQVAGAKFLGSVAQLAASALIASESRPGPYVQ